MNKRLTMLKPPYLSGDNVDKKRQELKDYFNNSWDAYEDLFSLIANEAAYYKKPEPLRHPLIFYYGHTAVFCVNKLILGKYLNYRLNPQLEALCAVGVDEMSWDDLDKSKKDWPTLNTVNEYRNQVKILINQLIDSMTITLPIKDNSLAWLILMITEHQNIHLETSSVLIRMLDLNDINAKPSWAAEQNTNTPPKNELIAVKSTSITLGKNDDTYGWDNEYGEKTVNIETFLASKYLVSNGEFLQFIEDGGYCNNQHWNEEGKKWLAFSKATMPRFWLRKDKQYYQRNLISEMPLPLDWPVEVNYLEAKAFCNWLAAKTGKSIRLPTEGEWYCLRDNIKNDIPAWQYEPGNINLAYTASSSPVTNFQQGEFFDIVGNVWQWTETHIDGFPGFKPHPLYDDFSTPTFDGKHNLIKGGSWISVGNEACRSSRYAFRRHFFQHAGFRYVEAEPISDTAQVNSTITEEALALELHTHFGTDQQIAQNSIVNCIEKIAPLLQQGNTARALDIGCSVGRGSFELAKIYQHVDGIDFTARHIQQALTLCENDLLRYQISTEGLLHCHQEISLAKLGYTNIKDRVHFSQGDAHNLHEQHANYDLVFCNFILSFLYDPKLFLKEITARLNINGLLVINSNFQWDEQYCPQEKWLGGYKKNAENYTGNETLHFILQDNFKLIDHYKLQRTERRNLGLYHLKNSSLTVWQRHV